MLKKLIKDVVDAIRDHNRDFSERVFLIFAIISETAVFIAFVIDIITGEHLGELVVIASILVFVPTIILTCFYKNRMKLATKIIVTALVLIVLPGLFFFGGGLEGGGVLWIIFAFVYIGLVISGTWRNTLLVMLMILAGSCYLIEYLHPEIVPAHSRGMFFIDSFVSLILVGIVCFFMTWMQSRMFMDENARARKEAERAEELTRSQNRFFSSMSHEIRTPINSILGLNELILREENASDEIMKDAAGIQGSGRMLLALINDILDFSKLEAGSMDIVAVDYRVGDMLSDIVNMIWLRAHDKGLQLNVSVDPKVPSVLYGDEVRIKQIIINLLNNAVKYTVEGSVEFHVESTSVDADNVELSISVSDTGIGIKKETLPYLFDAFKRVDEERNRHIEGTGLGLSIVKQLVELMGGTVSVNSVYGEGSTFTAVIRQKVSDITPIGELNIHNEQKVRRSAYEAGFKAPEAKILIVDDNEMNIEVESKLLSVTDMKIDKALSGKEALSMALSKHYDVILMDHLMPEMDGIECLELLRNQPGGLNRTTPVIVLTANAGSDNRALYSRSGFEGYLVKPVSGEALENTLVRYISSDKLLINRGNMRMREDINASERYSGKVPVMITSNSVCDLPDSVIKRLNLRIIPALIRTDEGVFKDGVQMDADELIRYMETGGNATSMSMNEAAYTDFFANALKRAHNLIHISIISSMSSDYKMASEAAKSFDNVTVINSGCLSSATGLLVLIAYKLAQQNMSVQEIVNELELVKDRLRCSFIVDTTEYMVRKGFVSPLLHKVARGFNLHPALSFKNDRFRICGVWMGSTRRAYRKYIRRAFPAGVTPDPDIVFITFVDIPMDTLLWIRDEISRIASFERVVFKQASAAISSNCGSGTFGILYFAKGNTSYNIGAYADEDVDDKKDDVEVLSEEELSEPKWYERIEGINGDTAIKNSGSEEALRTVFRMFHDSIEEKAGELGRFYEAEDYKNYVIKIHALKSSARLIGAEELGERAELLEHAGNEGNIAYIKEKHDSFMADYLGYEKLLSGVIPVKETGDDGGDGEKVLNMAQLEERYQKIREAAETIDSDTIDEIINELSEYELPKEERERYEAICEKAGEFDYDGILELLEG